MIAVDRVTKFYGQQRALNSLSFHVNRGEVLGFLGPNGAGKTTMMKIITCYINPTRGSVKIAGHNVEEEPLQVKKLIGYLPENAPLYQDMIVAEYLSWIAQVRQIPKSSRQARMNHVVDICGLGMVVGRPIGELSKGYRQRVGLAQALIHEPEILVLDEPTSGLDPNQIVEIRDLIKEIGKEKTVILSTHILPEVEATCTRAVIINEGHIVADGALDDLRHSGDTGKVHIKLKTKGTETDNFEQILATIPGVKGIKPAPGEPDGVVGFALETASDTDIRESLFHISVDRKWVLMELRREEMVLEDVFRRLTINN